MGDHTQLAQLFMHLVGNGITYCQGRTPQVKVSDFNSFTQAISQLAG